MYNIKTHNIEQDGCPIFTFVPDPIDEGGEAWMNLIGNGINFISLRCSKSTVCHVRVFTNSEIPYPATYTESGSWVSSGGDTKAYLEEEVDGKQNWEHVVGKYWNKSVVDKIKKDRGETYRICIESTSALVRYANKDGIDYYEPSVSVGGDQYDRLYGTNKQIAEFFYTSGIDITTRTGSGSIIGTANRDWLQSIANGITLRDTEDSNLVGVPVAASSVVSSSQMRSQGYGFATIKPILTPIHTCNGHTPGDPEEPDPNKGTDGKCTIQKVYWTTYYDKDGNFLRRSPAINKQRSGTTNYIVIDSEPGYTVRKWSTNSGPINPTPENWEGYSGIHNGKGGGEIVLDEEGGEKYLAVWLEKIEVDKTPPSPPEDFLIEESQITRRISFEDSAKTLELLSHEFVFESAAPNKSYEICYANGGHFTCTNTSTGHSHSFPACYSFCSGYSWTDNDTKLGIVNNLAKDSKYYSVLSKHQQTSLSSNGKSINSDVPEYNTKNNYASRGGTGSSTLTYPGFAYNCIIFRGKDQLVLADWKNAKYYPESKTLVMMQTP